VFVHAWANSAEKDIIHIDRSRLVPTGEWDYTYEYSNGNAE